MSAALKTFRDFLYATMESCSPHYKDHHDHLLQLSKSSLQPTETCTHPKTLKAICVDCGQRMDDEYGVAFDYITEGLRFSNDEVSLLKRRNSEYLFSKEKLQLVLDLDHTLLHAAKLKRLTAEEMCIKNKEDSSEDISNISLFQLENGYLVKLRPYVRKFLQEASEMFEMYVYTMGSRTYAKQMGKLLDPEGKYFNCRLICREDLERGMLRKTLNLVLGEENGIIILDDTELVWKNHSKNLIVVEKYNYFNEGKSGSMNPKSYSEKKTEESETNGVLINLLKSLRKIHGLFFNNPACRDVRILLGKVRSEILKGCTLFFSSDVDDLCRFWNKAQMLGAECTIMLDSSSVTHVVSSNAGSNNSCRWAEEKKKFLVHPQWINAAYYYWCRQPEEEYFPVLSIEIRGLLLQAEELFSVRAIF